MSNLTNPSALELQQMGMHPDSPASKLTRARLTAIRAAEVRDRMAGRIRELEVQVKDNVCTPAEIQIATLATHNRAGVGASREHRVDPNNPNAAIVGKFERYRRALTELDALRERLTNQERSAAAAVEGVTAAEAAAKKAEAEEAAADKAKRESEAKDAERFNYAHRRF